MKQIVRTRIPPSPTGQDLHIGNLYTALINFVFAKKNQGSFILRIEDTDRTRYVAGAETRIMDSLKWAGVTYDEGPDVGGPHSPYRQSERLSLYKKHAEELVEKAHAYYCFCTTERLTQMRQEQEAKHLPPMYDGLCKTISLSEAKTRAQSEKYVIRLNVPDDGVTTFTDIIRGEVSFENKLIDDQVLLKSDGYPTYHLAVIVDDYLMKITHVIRGEDWISSTPKHVLLYHMLGWELPHYAHLPLLRNPDKSKLSKRKNPVWVSWYRERGFLPEALVNYLGTLAWSMPDGRDIFSLNEMMQQFDLRNVKTTAPIFNIEKLMWFNGEYIRKMSPKELLNRLKDYLSKDVDEKLVEQLLPLAQERLKKLTDFVEYLKPFQSFSRPTLIAAEREILNQFLSVYKQLLPWKRETLEKESKGLISKENWKLRDALLAVRVAVTGTKIGLPLFETLEILGKDEVIKRLQLVLD